MGNVRRVSFGKIINKYLNLRSHLRTFRGHRRLDLLELISGFAEQNPHSSLHIPEQHIHLPPGDLRTRHKISPDKLRSPPQRLCTIYEILSDHLGSIHDVLPDNLRSIDDILFFFKNVSI